jgi:hypothetical protein
MVRYGFLVMLISAFLTDIAHAYVGPGLGLGVIGAIVGIIVAVFLAIVGVIWYPLKRMMRKLKTVKANTSESSE